MKYQPNLLASSALVGMVSAGVILPDDKRSDLAAPSLIRARTRDSLMTFDQRTVDSTGSFLVGELERLDPTLNQPLVDFTWSRDIDLRTDVTIADEVSSFTNSSFASAGGISTAGKSWVGKDANSIAGIQLDIGKTAQPLTLWAAEISWTVPELESAQRIGRPVDSQKLDGLHLKHQMDTDEQVYIGDTVLGVKGLVNHASVAVANVADGVSGQSEWEQKTPDEILTDFNEGLTTSWGNAGYAVMSNKVLLPPAKLGYLATQKVSQAGDRSILKYVLENNIAALRGAKLAIEPVKWLIGRGVGGTPGTLNTVDRMVFYNQDQKRVRFPMTPLQRTPLEFRSLYQMTTYFGRLGVVEFPYPETALYRDGI